MIGKIVGGIFGLMLGGILYMPWLGLGFGLWLGHRFDQSLKLWVHQASMGSQERQVHTQRVFFQATFSVMGHIAKSNGRVSSKEIAVAERIMAECGLSGRKKQEAIEAFRRGKSPDFQLMATLDELHRHCGGHFALLQLFVECQYKMAYAEGQATAYAEQLLERICRRLGLVPMPGQFDFFQQAHGFQDTYRGQQRHRHQGHHDSSPSLASDYQTLGLSQSAKPIEIKRAYRKLMAANHPDKLMAKGLPEDMIKMATEKTQKIKSAYERIKKAKQF